MVWIKHRSHCVGEQAVDVILMEYIHPKCVKMANFTSSDFTENSILQEGGREKRERETPKKTVRKKSSSSE